MSAFVFFFFRMTSNDCIYFTGFPFENSTFIVDINSYLTYTSTSTASFASQTRERGERNQVDVK